MGYNWKNGSQLKKRVTLNKYGPHFKNWLHLENGPHLETWVTFGNMGHIWKSGSHLEKWVTLAKTGNT